MKYAMLIIAPLFNSIGMTLFKVAVTGSGRKGNGIKVLLLNPFLIIAVVFMIGNLIVLGNILRKMNLNVVFPIVVSLGYIFVGLLSKFYLNEELSVRQFFGYVFLIIGSCAIVK